MKTIAKTSSLTLLLSACFLLCSFGRTALLQAQDLSEERPLSQYVHDHWTAKDGLPQNAIYSLLQSRDGYLWFGTQEGLVRFDGVRFTVYDRTNSKDMKHAWVVFLKEDSQGAIWMTYSGRGSGIGVYKDGAVRSVTKEDGLRSDNVRYVTTTRDSSIWFVQGPDGITRQKNGVMSSIGRADGLPSDTVFAVSDDAQGNLWFATPEGIVRFDKKGYTLFSTQDGLPRNRVWWINHGDCIFEDSKSTIWMATDSGVVRFDAGGIKTFTRKDGLLENRVYGIVEDKSGTLWFVTNSGVTSMQDGVVRSYKPSVPFEGINDLCLDPNDDLWLATPRGLWRLAKGTYDHFGREQGMVDETVNSVFVDAEGSIWFGSDTDGLHRLREGKFVTYGSEAGVKDPVLTAVMEDSKGNLWLGSISGGIARLSEGAATVFDEKQGLPRRVDLISEGKDGTIWLGTRTGLFTLRNGSISPYPVQNDPPFTDPRALFFRSNGDLIVAEPRMVYTLADHRLKKLFPQQDIRGISSVMEDSKGQIWIGTFGNGLYRFGNDSLVHFTPEQGFVALRVFGMYAGRDGEVWIATESDGLFLFRDGKFVHFTPENGLFDYTISSIMEDDLGSMWFSNNKGVYRIRKQALEDFASGKSSSYRFDTYGTADGMKSREANFLGHPDVWKMRDGRIVFPTVAGAAVVDPAVIKLNTVPPRVVLEGFTADKVSHDLRQEISLPPGTNNLEINYVGISFIGSDQVKYKYRLDGYEANWIDPGRRTAAFYTHLGPGDYTFHIIAANADGVWDTTGAAVSFAIRPHFYESRWFYAFALLGFLFGGPSVYYLRVRQLKHREAELARQVDLRTKELRGALDNLKETQNQLVLSEKMASLGQLTAGIAHEIKNPLNFITNFAVLSGDLAKDLREELAAERDRVDPKRAEEIGGLLNDLEQNVQKINEHGKRADSIVRGMLLHSRGKAGERQETDLNALLAEYTNLAYHGMRAQDTSFNIKIETDLDPSIGKMNIVPQDLSRAFLNIVNNACYAANDRKKSATNGFSPVVRVSARNLGSSVEIRVRDNGSGIPQTILDKIFNPFFTTKPAGAGTGLGLSLSFDIITQEHKGEIHVDTKEGEFTEFIISIPRLPLQEGGPRA
jgi:ligand-binding sensor domain-containing protein/signal transduction histidine kinase